MPSALPATIDERAVTESEPAYGLGLPWSRLHGLKALTSALSLRSISRSLGFNPLRRAAPGAALPIRIVRNGLVAEWRFDEGAGQVVGDDTGNGHDGVLGFTAGVDPFDPTWTARGLSFDGTEAAWFADAVGICGGAARTVIAVVKTGPSGELGWSGTEPEATANGGRWTGRVRELCG
jgi:hypothetical protein